MKQGTVKVYLYIFTILMLFFGCMIRSGVLVDKSFLPRYFLVSVLLFITWVIRFRKITALKFSFFELAFILFYLWNLASCLWAISPSEAILQAQTVFISLALFLMISGLCHEYEAFENIFIRTLLIVLLVSFALAFYKMSTLEYFDPYQIISISANNNLYAGFLIISLPFIFAGYSLNKGFWKFLSVAVAILSLFFVIIVQTRAAYIGLGFSLVLSFIFLFFRYKSVFTRRNIYTGIVSSILLLAGIFLFYSSLDPTRKSYFLNKIAVWQYFKSYDSDSAEKLLKLRNAKRASNSQTGEFDFSESYYENANLRVIFWKKSIGLIKSHPLLGIGAGNWRINIPSCKEPPNPEHTLKNYTYSQPHNEWISLVSELGIAGLLLAVIIFFVPVIVVLYRIVVIRPGPPVEALFYCCFILGFYVYAVFDFPFKRIEHNVILFSMMAFLLHKAEFNRIDAKTLNTNDPVPGTSRLRAFAVKNFLTGTPHKGMVRPKWLFTLAFGLLLLFTIFIASARISGEYYTLKMFMNEGKNDDKVIQYCNLAENPFYRITPNTLPLAWFEGVARYRKGDAGAAMTCFQRALKSTPYEVRVLNDYAASMYSLNRTGEAKAVLLKAIDIDPFFDDARFNLGAIYYFSGNRDSALFQVSQCRNSQKRSDFLEELKVKPGYPQ